MLVLLYLILDDGDLDAALGEEPVPNLLKQGVLVLKLLEEPCGLGRPLAQHVFLELPEDVELEFGGLELLVHEQGPAEAGGLQALQVRVAAATVFGGHHHGH